MPPNPPTTLPAHEARRLWAVAERSEAPEVEFRRLERRRQEGEPLQYLEGTAAFGPLDLIVDERVLIPRPETEGLWELAASLVGEPRVIVDLGTGSGALAIAMAKTFPEASVYAVDMSRPALEVARLNGERLDVDVTWIEGDLWSALGRDLIGRVDLVVSNPPYLAQHEMADLPEDVRKEPELALVAGPTGNEVLEIIAGEAPLWLRSGGWIACEIDERRGNACHAMFGHNLTEVEIRQDLTGRDRYVIGMRP
jgi:release factor glutamine methyltransferase